MACDVDSSYRRANFLIRYEAWLERILVESKIEVVDHLAEFPARANVID